MTMRGKKIFHTVFAHYKTLLDKLGSIFVESVRIHSINNYNNTIAIIKTGF